MANENILRSYLTSIGYKIDEDSYRKFRANLLEAGKRVAAFSEKMEKLAIAATAVATAVAASVIKISAQMERLYFASQRTGSSAKNMQALEYAAQQIGVAAEDARGALEAMAGALRTQPGLQGLLQSFNVNPNEEGVQRLIDLVEHLHKLGYPVATQYAGMFGLDEQTFKQLYDNLDELKARMEEGRRLSLIDDDKVKKFHEFMDDVRELKLRVETLADTVAFRFLPVGKEVIGFLDTMLDRTTALGSSNVDNLNKSFGFLLRTTGNVASELAAMALGLTHLAELTGAFLAGPKGFDAKVAEINKRYAAMGDQLFEGMAMFNHAMDQAPSSSAVKPQATYSHMPWTPPRGWMLPTPKHDVVSLLEFYAKKFGVNPDLMKALAMQESGDNQDAVSKKGAIGVMQLMPDTARRLGVDPRNLDDNIRGGVQLMSDLLKRYHSEILALAAYNAGTEAVDKYHGVPPFPETQNYIRNIERYRLGGEAGTNRALAAGDQVSSPVTINQDVDIHVQGGEARETADRVLKGQKDVNADIFRHMKGNVR